MQSKLYLIPRHLYETFPNVFVNGNVYIITQSGTPYTFAFGMSSITEIYRNKLKDDGYREKFKSYLSEYLFNYCGHEIEINMY